MDRRRLLATGAITVSAALVGCLGAEADGDGIDEPEQLSPQRSGHVEVSNTADEPYYIDVTLSSLDPERNGTPPPFEASAAIAPGDTIRAHTVVSRTETYRIEAQTTDESVTHEWDVENPGRHGAGVARISVEENGGLDVGIFTFEDA